MFDNKALSDEILNKISGGVLPEGWQDEAMEMIRQFKTYVDPAKVKEKGYNSDAEALVAMIRLSYTEDESNISPADLEVLCDFILKNY